LDFKQQTQQRIRVELNLEIPADRLCVQLRRVPEEEALGVQEWTRPLSGLGEKEERESL
jgi:hypothetical protein